MTGDPSSPVAILDKVIANYPLYRIRLYELCDRCGARFGIGFHQACAAETPDSIGELPDRLREMLREDHGHGRGHKAFTEIWTVPEISSIPSAYPLRGTRL